MDRKPFRTEEAEGLLTVYSGNQPVNAAVFQAFLDRWAEQFGAGARFAVALVYEAHDYEYGERNADEEDRFAHAMGEFRRRHHAQANRLCTGFARVFPAAWFAGLDAEKAARYEVQAGRFAAYTFGVRGKNFTDLGEAKGWLASISGEAPLDLGPSTPENSGNTIGFFYGSTTGTTEFIAEKVQAAASLMGMALQPVNISELREPRALLKHDALILGVPTWNVGQLQDDWLTLFPELGSLDFSGKQVALFGVGDQVGYPDNFLDALGTLGHKLRARGATLIGFWSTEGYTFTASKAQVGGQFMGLGLDDYNQEDLTDGRIAGWLEQLHKEFGVTERPLEYA